MRALVAGDTHANYQHLDKLIKWAKKMDCDAIVQVGDFAFIWRPFLLHKSIRNALAAGTRKESSLSRSDYDLQPHDPWRQVKVLTEKLERVGIQMFFLDGNHEDYELLSYLTNIYFGDPDAAIAKAHDWTPHHSPVALSDRLSYLPRSSTWEWDGVHFMAMGGAVSVDREWNTLGVDYFYEEDIKPWDIARALYRPRNIDVMFTHDVPEGVPHMVQAMASGGWHLSDKLDKDSTRNRVNLERIRAHHHPKLLFHGHMHHDYVDEWRGTRIRGLNRDKSGNRSWFVFDTEEFHEGIIR